MNGYMRTVGLGGYDKQDVLMLIDAYNQRIYELELAINEKRSIGSFMPPPLPKKVRIGGFDAKDFDDYLSDLKAKVAELENKHRTIMAE